LSKPFKINSEFFQCNIDLYACNYGRDKTLLVYKHLDPMKPF
jgi:hypothetical protein